MIFLVGIVFVVLLLCCGGVGGVIVCCIYVGFVGCDVGWVE